MRISDWSSDVCASDLTGTGVRLVGRDLVDNRRLVRVGEGLAGRLALVEVEVGGHLHPGPAGACDGHDEVFDGAGQAELGRASLGKECVRPFRSRWPPCT